MRTRSIVAILLGVTALFVFVGAAVFLVGGDDRRVGAINTATKSFAAGKYVLQTDGANPQFLGFLSSYEGCRPKGSVAKDPPDAQGVIRKSIAGVANEPCVLRFGHSMKPAFWSLIANMAQGTAPPRSFQILSATFDYKVVGGVRLIDAVPRRFVINQLDPSSQKQGPTFQLTLVPDSHAPVGPEVIGSTIKGVAGEKAKIASNVVFKLGTLEMKRVNKLGPIEVSLAPGTGNQPAIQISDFDVSLSLVDAPAVRTWFDDFVIQGNDAPANEQTATIELTDASLKNALMTFTLKGVGIFDVYDEVREAGSEQLTRAIFSVYAEELQLAIQGGFPPASPQPSPEPGPTPPPPPPPPPTETTRTTPEETRKLAAPEELTGKISGDREVEFTWTPVEGAESYVILAAVVEKEEPVYNELAESREPAAIVADLRPGTYLFVVRARAGESESESSKPIEIVIE